MTATPVVTCRTLFQNEDHRCLTISCNEQEDGELVASNHHLIIDQGQGCLLDPGGVEVFPDVFERLAEFLRPAQLRALFVSHQDPDVASGLAHWLSASSAQAYVPQLWMRFLPHFGLMDLRRLVPVPDAGCELPLGADLRLQLIPAHFLHSEGNFSVYDPVSRILFSGDIASSMLPSGAGHGETYDLAEVLPMMEPFHRRFMNGNAACRRWVARVRGLDIDVIAPQHGSVLRGAAVGEFLDWFEHLRCGVDLIDEIG